MQLKKASFYFSLQRKATEYAAGHEVGTRLDSLEHPLVALCAVSGAGKDSTKKALLGDPLYHRVVSHTTRRKRINEGQREVDGVDYHFINRIIAHYMLDNHKLIEANWYSNNMYGISVAEVEMAAGEGRIPLADIDKNGIDKLEKLTQNIIPIFLIPPSFPLWMERLLKRYQGKINYKDLRERLRVALAELEHLKTNDHYYVVINKDLHKTVIEVDMIARGGHAMHRTDEAKKIIDDLIHMLTRLPGTLDDGVLERLLSK
ncbi:MAG TPA: hypothetical protein VFT87_01820 [Candidatus Saccharimonadales bacterium]|nr:hypothetical protein [Candidatus Saccharimonadales bacterium]